LPGASITGVAYIGFLIQITQLMEFDVQTELDNVIYQEQNGKAKELYENKDIQTVCQKM
jgi:hypothetical protein